MKRTEGRRTFASSDEIVFGGGDVKTAASARSRPAARPGINFAWEIPFPQAGEGGTRNVRLAEEPESFARTWADKQIAKYPEGRQASAVLSLLWRAQKQNDYWLPKPAIENVARMLDMPYIRVLEIATFYTMFNLAPVGRFFIQMCGTTPCQLQGSDGIKDVLERRVGPQRKVTADGNFSWLEVECLGACCNAPMVQINDDYYEDLTPENFDGAARRSRRRPPRAYRLADRPQDLGAGRRPDLADDAGTARTARAAPTAARAEAPSGRMAPTLGHARRHHARTSPLAGRAHRRTRFVGSPATEHETGQREQRQSQSPPKASAARPEKRGHRQPPHRPPRRANTNRPDKSKDA